LGRNSKQKVDFFPHFVRESKTKRILSRYWGNTGYAFWFKLLELLCDEDNQALDLSGIAEWEDFLAYTITDENTANAIMNKLAEIGKIDAELWRKRRIVWCQSLVENLRPLYSKRVNSLPGKPLLSEFPSRKSEENSISDGRNQHSRVEKSKEEESIAEKSKEEYIIPADEKNESGGESLSVEMAEDQSEKGSFSMTRKPRKRKITGILTKKQQEWFDMFWQAYPNKKSPGQAEKTFAKLCFEEDLFKEIMNGVERAKKYDSRFRDRKYTPHPSSWLNAKGWLDRFDDEAGNISGDNESGRNQTGNAFFDMLAGNISGDNESSGNQTGNAFFDMLVGGEKNDV